MKKSNLPKVSIIIPVYNGSNFLKEAIDSALAQTYKNLEIIVVNDGSADQGKTEKIAMSYGSKIRYYKKVNGGVSTALNLGIKKMTGDYFSWLSHDDIYYPKKIENQVRFVESLKNKNVIVYANYALLQDSRIVPVELNHEQLVRKPKYSLLRGSVNGITLLIPRSILSDVGEFDEELRCTQDYDLWCRAFRKYDFVHMEEILTVTRIHGAQDSAVSPNVVKEGDILWKRLIEELSDKEKIEYENTVYNYYYEMSKFLRTTPYKGALAYSLDKEKESLEKTKHNESEKLVTVVIPFRNRVNDTLNSIKSVQEQTYKNTEIILIDDASTEDVSSLENYVKNLQNASLISLEKNLGPGGARNVGIRVAKGEYVAFLDSDDEFISEKLQTQIEAMRLHNPHVSYTAYTKKTETDESVIGGYGISGVVIPRLISSCPIATPTVIVRRKILLDEGIFFDESIRVGEDTCFWLEIAKKHEILYVDKPLTVVNVNASTNAYDSKKFIIGLKNILAYLLNDKYYSSFSYDIALLCNDYYQVNRSDRLMYENGLVLEDYWKPSVSQFIKHKLKKSLPYLVVRKFRANGLRGVAAAVVKRAKIRT